MDRTDSKSDTPLTQTGSRPVRYRLFSPEGFGMGMFDSAIEAASAAGGIWPGVGQRDDDRPGWDIQVVGS